MSLLRPKWVMFGWGLITNTKQGRGWNSGSLATEAKPQPPCSAQSLGPEPLNFHIRSAVVPVEPTQLVSCSYLELRPVLPALCWATRMSCGSPLPGMNQNSRLPERKQVFRRNYIVLQFRYSKLLWSVVGMVEAPWTPSSQMPIKGQPCKAGLKDK